MPMVPFLAGRLANITTPAACLTPLPLSVTLTLALRVAAPLPALFPAIVTLRTIPSSAASPLCTPASLTCLAPAGITLARRLLVGSSLPPTPATRAAMPRSP